MLLRFSPISNFLLYIRDLFWPLRRITFFGHLCVLSWWFFLLSLFLVSIVCKGGWRQRGTHAMRHNWCSQWIWISRKCTLLANKNRTSQTYTPGFSSLGSVGGIGSSFFSSAAWQLNPKDLCTKLNNNVICLNFLNLFLCLALEEMIPANDLIAILRSP